MVANVITNFYNPTYSKTWAYWQSGEEIKEHIRIIIDDDSDTNSDSTLGVCDAATSNYKYKKIKQYYIEQIVTRPDVIKELENLLYGEEKYKKEFIDSLEKKNYNTS